METIDFEVVDLKKQTIIKDARQKGELRLGAEAFIVIMFYRASEPPEYDESLPWIEVGRDFIGVYRKTAFSGLERTWWDERKRWMITLHFQGVASDIRLHFKKQKDCDPVFEKLSSYFFNTLQ